MANTLQPQNDAERRTIQDAEAGDLSPEFLRELADRIDSTRAAASTVAPQAEIGTTGAAAESAPVDAAATPESIQEEPLTPMSFAELQALLAPKGVDLMNKFYGHIAFMARRGIIPADKIHEYEEKFQTIYVRKSELENIPKGYCPMLFVDDMTKEESAKAFDVPLFGQELSTFTKRDLNNIDEPLPNQNPSGLARLTFVPDVTNLTSNFKGKSTNTMVEQMKQGKHFMEPAQYFQYFAECLEKAIQELNLGNGKDWKDMNDEEKQAILANKSIDSYLPDAQTWTQFPAYRNQFGNVLDFFWNPVYRKVFVSRWSPRHAFVDLGVRPLLG